MPFKIRTKKRLAKEFLQRMGDLTGQIYTPSPETYFELGEMARNVEELHNIANKASRILTSSRFPTVALNCRLAYRRAEARLFSYESALDAMARHL
jgi:hypothetical protein